MNFTNRDLYESIVTKVAAQLPLYGKALVDMGLKAHGLNKNSFTPIELLDLIENYIDPRLQQQEGVGASVLNSGTGTIVIDSFNRVVQISPFLGNMLSGYLKRSDDSHEKFISLNRLGVIKEYSEISHLETQEKFIPLIKRYFNITYIKTSSGQMTAVINDATVRKYLELSFRDYSTQLGITQKKLSIENEKAIEASRAKSEFLATISHEIRTPLNGAITMAQVLSKTTLDDDQRKQVESIIYCGDSLTTLLNDVLDLSRIEAGKLELESNSFDLIALINELVSLMQSSAESRGNVLSVVFDEGLQRSLIGDQVRLRQVLFNLIGNAIKFTEQGQIIIKVETLPNTTHEDSTALRFEVLDTGIGIESAELHNLFEAFTQADSSISRKYGGTGLGLTICKRMVKLMGGEMGVDSIPLQGSSFWFEVIFSNNDQSEVVVHQPEMPVEVVAEFLNILLVEDDVMSRKAATALLEQRGHRVTTASDGLEALSMLEHYEQLKENPLDLILMDIRMPNIDGLETARRIRKMATPINATPIIALTADVTHENISECYAAQINAVEAKPISPDALFNTLQLIMNESLPAPTFA